MSSVGSADSSSPANAADAPRKKSSSDGTSNESELIKKHQKEIRRLNEQHYAEVDGMQKDHQRQMENLRKHAHTEISEKDHQFQKESEDMRGLYRKQLQEQADENQKSQETLRKSMGTDTKVIKQNSEDRFNQLNEDYAKKSRLQEESYAQTIDESRDIQKKSIGENREKIQSKAEKDIGFIKAERDEKVSGLQKGYDNYRQYAETRIRDQEDQKNEIQKRDSDNLLHAVVKERRTAEDQKGDLREGFKEDIQKTRARFEEAANKDRAAREDGLNQMRTGAGARMRNEIDNMKRQNSDLKEQIGQGDLRQKAAHKRETDDLGMAFQKSLDSYKEQRDMAITGSNDREHKNISKLNRDFSEREVEVNRFYKEHEDEQNQIQHAAYDALKTNDRVRQEQLQKQADLRVKNVYENSNVEKERAALFQGDTHLANQRLRVDEMKELRTKMEEDKRIAVTNLQEQLQKQEVQHSDRLSQVVSKYEKQIQSLKDQIERDKRVTDANFKRSTEEMQRVHKMGVDQLEEQHRNRIRQLEAEHNTEVKTLNKRSDEKVNQVLAEVRKS